ncbi:thiamine-binding protein [Salinilacihabitans rarus]|uniref:thiamine-binding protein n=1 Tax=Salinilacihabitans rarus TaxID=2961596 RepID=UPI0020C8D3B0|nr:thiamine-binding protein [Salinilacihabitans rarus]
MTAIARLEVVPIREQRMSEDIAAALDAVEAFDVTYELTPMGTVLEADDAGEIFAAARAAHDAIDEDRVLTSLEIDDQPDREQDLGDRVEAVERERGRS